MPSLSRKIDGIQFLENNTVASLLAVLCLISGSMLSTGSHRFFVEDEALLRTLPETALHYLIIKKQLKSSKFLIHTRNPINVHTQEMSGNMTLHHTAQLSDEEVCLLLIVSRANVNAHPANTIEPARPTASTGTPLARTGGRVLVFTLVLTNGTISRTIGR